MEDSISLIHGKQFTKPLHRQTAQKIEPFFLPQRTQGSYAIQGEVQHL